MLDQLSALGVRYDDVGFFELRRARRWNESLAVIGATRQRMIDLLHDRRTLLVINAEDDAVRVQKISHGGAFAKEFWIRNDSECAGCRAIQHKRSSKSFARAYGNRTLLNNGLVIFDRDGDFARDRLHKRQ